LSRIVQTAAAILALTAICACGYTVGYGKAGPVGTASRVSVPIFANSTHEGGVETLFTEALRREFASDPKTALADRESAEVTVMGTVTSAQSSAVSFLQGGNAVSIGEYVLRASVRIEAFRKGSNGQVYSGAFSGEEQYLSANEPIGTESNRRLAMRRLASRMMKEAHDMMIAGF
jgi:hypothetical protein